MEQPDTARSRARVFLCFFSYVKPSSPNLGAERQTSLIYTHKNLSCCETVNYVFVQSEGRAGRERSDLYMLGFYLCKLNRTPWQASGYTALYIAMWVIVLVSVMPCASQNIPQCLRPCAFLPPSSLTQVILNHFSIIWNNFFFPFMVALSVWTLCPPVLCAQSLPVCPMVFTE